MITASNNNHHSTHYSKNQHQNHNHNNNNITTSNSHHNHHENKEQNGQAYPHDDQTQQTHLIHSPGGEETEALHHRMTGPSSSSSPTTEEEYKDHVKLLTSSNSKRTTMTNNHHKRSQYKTTTKTSSRKIMQTIAGVAGNVLEWYDFAVFGYFSDVLGQVFFPPQEGHAAMIESFAVFGLAFLCRPIGGMMMGYIGDIYGRKRALELSIFLMAFPTFAMGCLPSYEVVGSWSVVFLTLVRMLQGLSVGGQLVSSLVYTCENNDRSQWGLYGSYVMAAANFGTLLGGLVSYAMRANLSEEELRRWGWRLPFLSGILVSVCGFYLRYGSDEEEEEEKEIDDNHGGGEYCHSHHGISSSSGGGGDTMLGENPIRAAFRKGNRKALAASALVPMLWSAGFYITFVWMATFMGILVDPPVPGAFGVNSGSLFLSVCLLFPMAGMLSDVFGRYRVMLIGGVSMGVLSPWMVMIISHGNAAASFFAQSTMGIALSLWGAPMCAWLVESFPPSMRLTSVAVGYNFAQAIVGGSSPALATYLVDTYGLHAPGFMVSFIATLSVTGLCMGPNSQHLVAGSMESMEDTVGLQSFENPSNNGQRQRRPGEDDQESDNDECRVIEMELI